MNKNILMNEVMASCHSITTVDGELVGDPLEIKMFHSTDWELDETVQKEKDNEEEYLC